MAVALIIVVFLTVGLAVFSLGAATYAPSSVLGARLRALGGPRTKPKPKVAIKERLEQALNPLSKAIPLSPSDVSRTRKWLIQAGYREARHLTIYVSSRLVAAALGFTVAAAAGGFRNSVLLVGVTGFGFLLPRFALKRLIKKRQLRIKLGMPDALDLTVICVEAGLALDQAL